MIQTWYFYDRDGKFHPTRFIGSTESVKHNTPLDHSSIAGEFDPLSQRIKFYFERDPDTGLSINAFKVVDYQPPPPNDDHEWNAITKRWQLTDNANELVRADAQARAELALIDISKVRALSEHILDPNNTDAIQRLDALESRAIELRAKLKR